MTGADLIGHGPLLLDFDGPICSIFAGYGASRVAQELVALLRAADIDPPTTTAEHTDPLEVLRWVGAACPPNVTTAVEDALRAAELRAVTAAATTPHGHEVIRAAHHVGLPVAVVSNNSAGAIEAYLSAHDLTTYVKSIIGRAYADPARMKPNPEPIVAAVRALGAAANNCVLIGDSMSDIEGARAAGVRVIGYANQPWKVAPFAAADGVITSMGTIVSTLSALDNG